MNIHSTKPTDHEQDDWENDPVWNLLDQASPPPPSHDFVQRVVAATLPATLSPPWWRKLYAPIPLATLTASAAAITLSLIQFFPSPTPTADPSPVALAEHATSIEEAANAEILNSAADNLDSFSDAELIALIGF